MQITDPTTNRVATVNSSGQLMVRSESVALQHNQAHEHEAVYQCIGTATAASGTVTVLHLKNTSSTKDMVVTYMRVSTVDLAGGTAVPSAAVYLQTGFNETVASGGTACTPTNTNVSSGKVSEVTGTQGAPTMAGTFVEMDRKYVESDGQETVYNKEGSWILGLNDTMSIRLVSNHTSGTAYARVSFVMQAKGA